MNIERIAVMAGTPIDTQMGVELFKSKGLKVFREVSISSNPEEQTLFQLLPIETRYALIEKTLSQLVAEGCECVFVYCNSLSASVDFEKFSKFMKIKIVTPLMVYKEWAKKYRKLAVISANAQGGAGIEEVLLHSNPKLRLISMSMLSLVEEIEKKKAPDAIIEEQNLRLMLQFFKANKVEALIMGCTHFPYLWKEMKKDSPLPLLNPVDQMFNILLT